MAKAKKVKLGSLEVVKKAATSIRPNKYNPNAQGSGDFTLLILSIVEDGFTQPIVVQPDGEIVDGEHRWTACIVIAFLSKHFPLEERGSVWPDDLIKEARSKRGTIIQKGNVEIEAAGFEGSYKGVDPKIDAVVVDMDAAQARIATLRHNRARGSEDQDRLGQVLADLAQLGVKDWAASSLGLEDSDFDRMIEGAAASAADALASEAFSQAWEPDVVDDDHVVEASAITYESAGGQRPPITMAATTSATEVMAKRTAALKQAGTAEERAEIKKKMSIHKVTAIFHGNEAELVRSVLGDEPANRLLALCEGRDHKNQEAEAS